MYALFTLASIIQPLILLVHLRLYTLNCILCIFDLNTFLKRVFEVGVKHNFLLLFLLIISNSGIAQIPVASFSLESPICIDEKLTLSNGSSDATEYLWDFCSNDFNQSPIISSIGAVGGLSLPTSVAMIQEGGSWFAFIVNRGSNKITRLDYGSDPTSLPTSTDLGTFGGLVTPDEISMLKHDGVWYAFITTDAAPYNLIRLEFINGIDSTPASTNLGNFSSSFNRPRGIDIGYDANDYIVVISNVNTNSLTLLNLGNSLNTGAGDIVYINTPAIPNASSLFDMSLIEFNDVWYGFATSLGTSRVHKITFGPSLYNNPTTTEFLNPSGSIGASTIDVIQENDRFFAFLGRGDNSYATRLFEIADLSSSFDLTEITLTGAAVLSSGSLHQYESGHIFNGIDVSGNLYSYQFNLQCGASSHTSLEELPNDISYNTDGTYEITLKASNMSGDDYITETLIVTSNIAPSINFSSDNSQCVSNPVTFIPNISGLTTYSWDFNEDGIEDSDVEEPTFDFGLLGTGTYMVRLDVDDGFCGNFYEEEITIYDDPPVPNFTVSTLGTLCTNNEIIFSNTTNESGYDDVLTYRWLIDGEEATQKDTVYTFLTNGDKVVSLQAFLPGCESVITEQIVSINIGPEVDFGYTNNCFGEEVQFLANLTGSGINDFEWDFGDGSPVVTNIQNPAHQFDIAGDYLISLTATNIEGCETTYQQTITVNDQPLVAFTVGTQRVENLPVSFFGEDLTLAEDDISSWTWDFDGLGTSSEMEPNFTFPLPGDYLVTLDVNTSQGCSDTYELLVSIEEADCPSPSFSMAPDVCIGEKVRLTNTSVNANEYLWDFCEELGGSANFNVLNSIGGNLPLSATYAFDNGEWYGFITDRSSGKITRLGFGVDLFNSAPTLTELGNPSSLLNLPDKIRLFEEDGLWYGLILNSGNSEIIRVGFGADLNSPSISWIVESIGNPESSLSQPRGLELIEFLGNVYAIISNQGDNSVVVLNFRESITNSLSAEHVNKTNIPGADGTLDVAVISECNNVEVFTSSLNTDQLFRISYDGDLMSTPTSMGFSVLDLTQPRRLAQRHDGHSWKVFALDNFGSMYRLNFANGITEEPISDKIDLLNDLTAFEFVTDSTAFLINSTDRELVRLEFSGNCESISIGSSTDYEPKNIYFLAQGTYQISLNAKDAEGRVATLRSTLEVTSSIAPSITFITDISRCISNTNAFTPSIPGLTSYAWDFNNDGIEDSNLENPTYDFSGLGAGTYTVRVDVSDGTCDNFYEEEITLYDPPPVPDYTIASTLFCLNTNVDFVNTTSDDTYAGPLAYSWEFIDDATSTVVGTSSDMDASFAFSTPGDKTIRLTSSIPGCEEVTEQTITINPGPTPDFFASSVCQNESMAFTNTSTNGVSYLWDFGDGFTSTSENPNHVYTTAGNYFVTLTATDANGCDASEVIEVAVSSLPEVNFDFDIPCTSASGVTFLDLSTVDNADVIDWSWSVDGEELSTSQNPTLSFEQSGVRTVTLVVTGSNGCQASFTQDVEILPSPNPDFEVIIGCQGELTSFEDITGNIGNPIVSWLWDVNGTNYTTNQVSHVFESPGIYEVTMEVTAQNFCTETVTKTIEVLQLPDVDFIIDGSCDNEIIYAEDLSTEFEDQIVSRRWMLDNTNVGNGSTLFLENLPDNSYDLTLEVETTSGCITSSSRTLLINQSPQAAVTFDRLYGLPGDQLAFTNASTDGTTFQWLLDGEPFSASSTDQNFIFESAGTYVISLVAENDLGCADTTNQEVLVAVPEVDLRIGTFDLIQEGTVGKIFFEVENRSNLPVESIEALVELENQFSVTEEINQFIDIGETTLVGLNVGIPLEVAQASYFCVTLNSQYVGYDDVNPVDNEKCLTLEPQITVEDPFPNPVIDLFRLKVVVPEEGEVKISLINSAGKLEIESTLSSTQGLNNFFIDMSALNPGIYFINVSIGDQSFQRKVIKR